MTEKTAMIMSNNDIFSKEKFETIQRMGSLMAASKMFPGDNNVSAAVKIFAGAELGLPPFASITGIHIVQGKPTMGSNLIASLIKNSGRYNYHVKKSTNEECIIEWNEEGVVTGESNFTFEEAKLAGLTGKDVWKKYPSDMLFARALTRGARRFCPGVFGGIPIYTTEELGGEIPNEKPINHETFVDAEIVEETIDEVFDVNDWCGQIESAKDINDLKRIFTLAFQEVKKNPEHVIEITKAKDNRKSELEAENVNVATIQD